MQLSASNPAPALSQESVRRGYQTYVLVLLMVVQALSYLDRTALNILVEPIRREFNLTDWQIGALVGPAFALLYALTLIGAGLVPLVGLLSDHLASTGLNRGESLRWALIYAQVTPIAGGALFWWARRRMAAAIVS